ncbi:MAG: hypothetical protein WBQ73_01675 [Candidatus Babeliales bacterium]
MLFIIIINEQTQSNIIVPELLVINFIINTRIDMIVALRLHVTLSILISFNITQGAFNLSLPSPISTEEKTPLSSPNSSWTSFVTAHPYKTAIIAGATVFTLAKLFNTYRQSDNDFSSFLFWKSNPLTYLLYGKGNSVYGKGNSEIKIQISGPNVTEKPEKEIKGYEKKNEEIIKNLQNKLLPALKKKIFVIADKTFTFKQARGKDDVKLELTDIDYLKQQVQKFIKNHIIRRPEPDSLAYGYCFTKSIKNPAKKHSGVDSSACSYRSNYKKFLDKYTTQKDLVDYLLKIQDEFIAKYKWTSSTNNTPKNDTLDALLPENSDYLTIEDNEQLLKNAYALMNLYKDRNDIFTGFNQIVNLNKSVVIKIINDILSKKEDTALKKEILGAINNSSKKNSSKKEIRSLFQNEKYESNDDFFNTIKLILDEFEVVTYFWNIIMQSTQDEEGIEIIDKTTLDNNTLLNSPFTITDNTSYIFNPALKKLLLVVKEEEIDDISNNNAAILELIFNIKKQNNAFASSIKNIIIQDIKKDAATALSNFIQLSTQYPNSKIICTSSSILENSFKCSYEKEDNYIKIVIPRKNFSKELCQNINEIHKIIQNLKKQNNNKQLIETLLNEFIKNELKTPRLYKPGDERSSIK